MSQFIQKLSELPEEWWALVILFSANCKLSTIKVGIRLDTNVLFKYEPSVCKEEVIWFSLGSCKFWWFETNLKIDKIRAFLGSYWLWLKEMILAMAILSQNQTTILAMEFGMFCFHFPNGSWLVARKKKNCSGLHWQNLIISWSKYLIGHVGHLFVSITALVASNLQQVKRKVVF